MYVHVHVPGYVYRILLICVLTNYINRLHISQLNIDCFTEIIEFNWPLEKLMVFVVMPDENSLNAFSQT